MTVTFDKHPYEVSLVYPHTATLATADAYVTLKAPERGDRRIKGRNQTFARLKNGNVIVYDMGTNMSDMLNLSFEQVPQAEFAAMIVFFEYVTWGANKIKYIDYKGDEFIVRIYKNTVDATNKGETKFGENESTLYDFTLDLIDVTNNVADSGQTAVPTQLAIHLADYNHPHNPLTYTPVVPADGTKVVESVLVDAVKHVSWLVSLSDGVAYSKTVFVHATHNGSTAADATSIGTPLVETIVTTGTDPGDITVGVTLTSAGATQAMNLTVAKAAGNVNVAVRRIKL